MAELIKSREPFLGKILNGRYEIIKRLGKGSYGVVYACRDHYLGRSLVALKIFHPKSLRYANSSKRLAQEIQAANRIEHENIVRFYDFFRCNDLFAISMEYVEGPSLRRYIEEQKSPDYALITDLIRQIALGLEIIHNNGIVHRDMKPDNILLSEGRNAKITDFGIAALIEENRDSLKEDVELSDENIVKKKRRLVGTMRYISPEAVEYGVYDKRSDLYALGVIVYELITGKFFFEYKDYHELLQLKVEKVPESPALSRPDCPLMLEKICLKLLQRNPDERYQDAEELLEDVGFLRSELAGLDVRHVLSCENLQSARIKTRKNNLFVKILCIFLILSLLIAGAITLGLMLK